MRPRFLLCTMLLASLAHSQQPKHSQSGVLLQMDSVKCGYDTQSGQSVAGEVIATDPATKKTHALLCAEYVLYTDHVIYHIRPKDEKHPVLLPVGEKAQFRLNKDKMMLRVETLDNQERDYTVVSMTSRDNAMSPKETSFHLNHLQ